MTIKRKKKEVTKWKLEASFICFDYANVCWRQPSRTVLLIFCVYWSEYEYSYDISISEHLSLLLRRGWDRNIAFKPIQTGRFSSNKNSSVASHEDAHL